MYRSQSYVCLSPKDHQFRDSGSTGWTETDVDGGGPGHVGKDRCGRRTQKQADGPQTRDSTGG